MNRRKLIRHFNQLLKWHITYSIDSKDEDAKKYHKTMAIAYSYVLEQLKKLPIDKRNFMLYL